MTTTLRTRRVPVVVTAGAVLLALLALLSSTGVVLFTVVWTDDVISPGLVFTAMFLATAATALAAIPGLLRGRRTAWLVMVGWTVAYAYWSVYKTFAEREVASAGYLVAALLLLALLAAGHRHLGPEGSQP